MKKVLIISYYFPPSGGSGVQRTLKFVKYLKEFGWEPIVLTVKEEANFPVRDTSLFQDIPDEVQIIRTPIFEPYGIYQKFNKKSSREALDISVNTEREKYEVTERISEWIRATFFIPDARCFWKRRAVRAGLEVIKREKIDAIFTSAPPYTCQLIGRDLKKRTGLPWVADFRDSWVDYFSTPSRWWLPRSIDVLMENSVLHHANHIIHVSDGVRNDLLSRHRKVSREKWSLITNGFDEDDFDGILIDPPKEKFILTYTGSIFGIRNPKNLLVALDQIFKTDPDMKRNIILRFVGRVDDSIRNNSQRFGSVIEHIPYVSHKESIKYLLNSSALLLIIGNLPSSKYFLTGKLFEYLRSRRPILALAPEGEAADLIRRLNAGLVVPFDDVDLIRDALLSLYSQWKDNRLNMGRSDKELQSLSRWSLTGQLAEVLNSLT